VPPLCSRGSVVVVAAPGDYGKPRRALVVQTDPMALSGSVVVCLITSAVCDAEFRVTVEPTPHNGLERTSQVMVDKLIAIPRHKLSGTKGTLDSADMRRVDRVLTWVLGLA
jgi:mRNA interferase MazF